jgi:hypothetical protein
MSAQVTLTLRELESTQAALRVRYEQTRRMAYATPQDAGLWEELNHLQELRDKIGQEMEVLHITLGSDLP